MNIEDIIKKHKQRKIPSFPQDDDFSEWVEELIELDAYYYGLAVSFIAGDKHLVKPTYLEKLKLKLVRFKDCTEDKEVYQDCIEFIESLELIVNHLQIGFYKK